MAIEKTITNRKNSIIGIVGLLLFLFAYTVIVYLHPIQGLSLEKMKWRWIGTRLFFWLLLGGLAIYSRKIEHKSICNIEQKKYAWWFYVLAMIVMFLVITFGSAILLLFSKLISNDQISTNYHSLKMLFAQYPVLGILTALTAGVTEEFFFRGYLQNRLTLLSNKYVGIIVSALLFGLLHYNYGTLIQVLFPFYLGLIFSIFYDKYKNITFLMVFHFLWDAVALYNLTHIKLSHH